MNDLHQTKNNLYLSLSFAAAVCLFCFVMHVMGNLWLINKHEWGVYPRQLSHWYGIFTSPFIHNSWGHLFANLAPLFVTLTMIFFFYRSISWAVFVMIWALTGFAVFMFARNSIHIGASGLVYGFIGFVFFFRNIQAKCKINSIDGYRADHVWRWLFIRNAAHTTQCFLGKSFIRRSGGNVDRICFSQF